MTRENTPQYHTGAQDEENGEASEMDSKVKQQRKLCPVPLCNAKVVCIPRHLVEVHGWSKEHARTALICFGLRKTYSYSSPSKVPPPPPPKKKKNAEEEMDKKQRE